MDQPPAPPTRGPPPSALIINDGTLGLIARRAEGIVRPGASPKSARRGPAQAVSPEYAPPLIWFPLDDRPARDKRRDSAARQTDLCAMSGLSERQLIRFDAPPHAHLPEGIGCAAKATTMVLAAAVEAASLGIERVIWPEHAGTAHDVEIEALADVCDRAMLIGQIMGLGTGGVCCSHERQGVREGTAITIETPYADFTDAQLMDLALDMDVPLSACWWCLNEDLTPCGHCAGCMRWREALAAVDPAGRLDIHVLATEPTPAAPRHP